MKTSNSNKLAFAKSSVAELNQMEMIYGGKSWLGAACGIGIVTLEASFAFPILLSQRLPMHC